MHTQKHSDETRLKISLATRGRKLSEAHKNKLREASIRNGNKPPSPAGRIFKQETLEKMRQQRLGNKSNLWKGGKTELTSLLRESYHYKVWRTGVYERDMFTCRFCGAVGGELQADHIVPFSLLLDNFMDKFDARELDKYKQLELAVTYEPLWNLDNGRTLCLDCHKTTDTYGKNTKYQVAGVSFRNRRIIRRR